MKRMFILLLCMSLCIGFGGCRQDQQSSDNGVKVLQLNCKMHFTRMHDTEHIKDSYEADLQATVTDYPDKEDSIDIYIAFPNSIHWSFDHENTNFTVSQEDKGLPYYCAYGQLYDETTHSMFPFVLAIDFEKEYLIFKVNGNTDECTVASADSDVDPREIHNHFQQFLDIYYYPDD